MGLKRIPVKKCYTLLTGTCNSRNNFICYRKTNLQSLDSGQFHNKEEERKLLLHISQGDEAAFSLIVRKYTGIVYPYLLYWVKNAHRAEDLTQDVFIRLWDKRHHLAQVENFGGYIYITARNIATAALDKHLLEMEELNTDKLYELTTQPARLLEVKELSAALNRGIDALPPRRKEVFLLSRMKDMTYDAIAEQLNISRSAVRQHIVEALVFLRHYLQQHAGVIVSVFWILLLIG